MVRPNARTVKLAQPNAHERDRVPTTAHLTRFPTQQSQSKQGATCHSEACLRLAHTEQARRGGF